MLSHVLALLLLLPRAASDASAVASMAQSESLAPRGLAIGPNGASLQEEPDAWLRLTLDDDRAASLAALQAAAAAHLHVVPEALLLADANGRPLRSIEQAVESGLVYGRHACEDSSRACEQWMWPASRLGERVSITASVNAGTSCELGNDSSADSCAADTMMPDDGDNRSFVLETLSTSPRVFRVASFLSKSELVQVNDMVAAPELCNKAGRHPAYCEWQPSVISGQSSAHAPRTSSTMWIGSIFGNHTKKPPFSQSKLLQGVVERAAGLLRTSPSLAEGMQVVKYAAGEHYHAHADYHTGRPGTEGYNRAPGFYADPSVRHFRQSVQRHKYHSFSASLRSELGLQVNRFASVLVYLNDEASTGGDFEGGETSFPLVEECPDPPLAFTKCTTASEYTSGMGFHGLRTKPWGHGGEVIADCSTGLRVVPRAGDAVLFYNLAGMHGETGAVDSSSWHSGCEVRGEGTKRAVNMWFFTGLPEKIRAERDEAIQHEKAQKRERRKKARRGKDKASKQQQAPGIE